ncbi:topoisomerase C-terminal repeat-containing protein [Siminovitchia sp. 179-K 8D1 HS]
MLGSGKTSLIKGFKSKNGNSFDAYLLIKNGKVQFEFPRNLHARKTKRY